MGIVFVLLLGEIDLSIGYVSGIGGVTVALLQQPGKPPGGRALLAILDRRGVGAADRSISGVVHRSRRHPLVRRHAGRAPRVAGGSAEGNRPHGVITFRATRSTTWPRSLANWRLGDAGGHRRLVPLAASSSALRRPPPPPRRWRPCSRRSRCSSRSRRFALVVVAHLQPGRRRAVPDLLDRRRAAVLDGRPGEDAFGRHVYAVGGNPEAARRAGINVARIRTLVFMLSSLDGWDRRDRLRVAAQRSVSTSTRRRHAGAVRDRVGGDRRDEPVRRPRQGPLHAVLGGLVIATIANGALHLRLLSPA